MAMDAGKTNGNPFPSQADFLADLPEAAFSYLCSRAKPVSLKAGEVLDGSGGYTVNGLCEKAVVARAGTIEDQPESGPVEAELVVVLSREPSTLGAMAALAPGDEIHHQVLFAIP